MRVKKQKRHRKIVKFYTACFEFRQPFKVLCDGTFIHHLLAHNITPADNAIANSLGAAVKLFTTKCVLAELKGLGSLYSEALEAGHRLVLARCDHESVKSADACIKDVTGEKNSEHFFVGTQDVQLRRQLQEIPGVPLIYGLRTALLLEPPSSFQKQFVKQSEEERLHMTDSEKRRLKMTVNKTVAIDEAINTSLEKNNVEHQAPVMQPATKVRTASRSEIRDKIQFKRKRAKGPNPLSCKKKKSHEHGSSFPQKLQESKDINDTSKKSRMRKRSHKRQKPSQMDN